MEWKVCLAPGRFRSCTAQMRTCITTWDRNEKYHEDWICSTVCIYVGWSELSVICKAETESAQGQSQRTSTNVATEFVKAALQFCTKSCWFGGGEMLNKLTVWYLKKNYVASVRERTIPNERPPLVPTFADRGRRVVSSKDPHGRILGFSRPEAV
jgi:hypothetical protein